MAPGDAKKKSEVDVASPKAGRSSASKRLLSFGVNALAYEVIRKVVLPKASTLARMALGSNKVRVLGVIPAWYNSTRFPGKAAGGSLRESDDLTHVHERQQEQLLRRARRRDGRRENRGLRRGVRAG